MPTLGGSSSLCTVFGSGQWQMSMKAMGWTYNDVSQEVQHFRSQRVPEMASLCSRSPDSNSLPLPGALHANIRQTVHWKKYNVCQCKRRKCASKMWEFPWSHHRSALQQKNMPQFWSSWDLGVDLLWLCTQIHAAPVNHTDSKTNSGWYPDGVGEPEFKNRGGFRGQVSKCNDIFCLWNTISWASNNTGEYWYVTKLASSLSVGMRTKFDPECQVLLVQCCIPDSGQW